MRTVSRGLLVSAKKGVYCWGGGEIILPWLIDGILKMLSWHDTYSECRTGGDKEDSFTSSFWSCNYCASFHVFSADTPRVSPRTRCSATSPRHFQIHHPAKAFCSCVSYRLQLDYILLSMPEAETQRLIASSFFIKITWTSQVREKWKKKEEQSLSLGLSQCKYLWYLVVPFFFLL